MVESSWLTDVIKNQNAMQILTSMPSSFRRCIHKLTVKLPTAENFCGGQHSAWIGLALHIPVSLSSAHCIWGSSSLSSLSGGVNATWVQASAHPAFLNNWGLKLWEEALTSGWISPVILFPPLWLGQLFWTLLLWICLVSETHRIFTICMFISWLCMRIWHYLWSMKCSQIFIWLHMMVIQDFVSSAAALCQGTGDVVFKEK